MDNRAEPAAAWLPVSRDDVLLNSWRRSWGAHGNPAEVCGVPVVAEAELDDALLHRLSDPLEAQSRGLAGTGVALLLTDEAGRVLQAWCPDSGARDHLAAKGTVRGADLSESSVGTNGVGTVISSGQAVQVRGGQHFARFYSDAICTGEPLHHPVSGALLGAVTLSCEITPRAELLRAWVRAIRVHLQACLAMRQPWVTSDGDERDLRLAAYEQWAVRAALSRTNGDAAAAAALLGISRATLYRRIARERRRAAQQGVAGAARAPAVSH